jgi:ubiquinone/menaquinone biosynthesis C-methylase UbiE
MKLRFDHFDLVAGWYDRIAGHPGPDSPLTNLLGVQPGQWLVDVGGGTGRNSAALRQAGANVAVAERSVNMANQACAKGLPAVIASADRLPFAANSAHRLLVVDAFHHFTIPHGPGMQISAAHELVRVLRPGGRLVIVEPDIRRWPVKLIAVAERLLLMRSRFLSPPDLVALFRRAGAHPLVVDDGGVSASLVLSK